MQFIKYSHFYLHALSFFYIFSPTGTSQFLRTNKVLHYIVCNGVGFGERIYVYLTMLILPNMIIVRVFTNTKQGTYRETTNQHKACIEKLSSIQIAYISLFCIVIIHSSTTVLKYVEKNLFTVGVISGVK